MNYFYKLDGKVGDAFLSGEINNITLQIYLLMLKRNSISKYLDDNGNKYFVLTREELIKHLKTNRKASISNSIKELEEIGAIIIKKSKGRASKYYIP